MSLFVDELYNWINNNRPNVSVTKSDISIIEDVANYFGLNPKWLANLINFESGFNTKAINRSSNATGLIQFMPSTARSLGTSVSELYSMSFAEQMQYVKKYIYNNYKQLKWIDNNGKPLKNKASQIDLFMMIFYPVAVGNENYPFPEKVVKANSGIATPKDYFNRAVQSAPFKKIIEISMAAQKFARKNIVPIIVISFFGMAIIGTVLYLVIKKKIK